MSSENQRAAVHARASLGAAKVGPGSKSGHHGPLGYKCFILPPLRLAERDKGPLTHILFIFISLSTICQSARR